MKFCDAIGHAPLSVELKVPWKCRRFVVVTARVSAILENDRRFPEKRARPQQYGGTQADALGRG